MRSFVKCSDSKVREMYILEKNTHRGGKEEKGKEKVDDIKRGVYKEPKKGPGQGQLDQSTAEPV